MPPPCFLYNYENLFKYRGVFYSSDYERGLFFGFGEVCGVVAVDLLVFEESGFDYAGDLVDVFDFVHSFVYVVVFTAVVAEEYVVSFAVHENSVRFLEKIIIKLPFYLGFLFYLSIGCASLVFCCIKGTFFINLSLNCTIFPIKFGG